MTAGFRLRAWSPYLTGAIIGLVQIPAFLLLGTDLGTSGPFFTVTAQVMAVADPAVLDAGGADRHLSNPHLWWQIGLVIGIVLGARWSARLSKGRRHGVAPVWSRLLGTPRHGVRIATAAFGGFLMMFGAGIADGCVTGHGLSGLAQLATSSFIVVPVLFATGIAAAHLLHRL